MFVSSSLMDHKRRLSGCGDTLQYLRGLNETGSENKSRTRFSPDRITPCFFPCCRDRVDAR